MKWCETCQCEYEDFAEVCSDCNNTLISIDEPRDIEVPYEFEDQVRLTNCSNNDEAHLLKSLLMSYGIQAAIQYDGTGSYLNILHGFNFQGANILVSEKNLEEAKEILRDFKYSHEDCTEEYNSQLLKQHTFKKRLIAGGIIIGFSVQFIIYLFIQLLY